MECLLSDDIKMQNRLSKIIDKELAKSRRREEVKLLLLGTGEAGKSTFIRQMRIIFDNGYATEDRKDQIKFIHQNIFKSMQNMIEAMTKLDVEYERVENATKNAIQIMNVDYGSTALEQQYLTAIKELWNDSGIQECYRRRSEYQLSDSTHYYLTKIDDIAKSDYIPTDQDILRIRIATTNLVEYKFNVKNIAFRMIDVGGQRSERRKWLRCFGDMHAIIFLTAISEYDQTLMESDLCNRLKESKKVFESITRNEYMDETSIIIFFNKMDIFHEKVMYSHLDEYFPEFTGPRCDVNAGRAFITDLFLNEQIYKMIYRHFTCAIDTQNIQVVFTAVRDVIVRTNLVYFGIE